MNKVLGALLMAWISHRALGQAGTCAGPNPMNCSGGTTVISQNCTTYGISLSLCGGLCNAVGVVRDSGSTAVRKITVGSFVSDLGGSNCNFLYANGHPPGSVGPLTGTITRTSGAGTSLARVATITTLSLSLNTAGTTIESDTNHSWDVSSSAAGSPSTASVLRVFEFEVTDVGNYDILLETVGNAPAMNNASYLEYALFDPGVPNGWRARNTNVGTGAADGIYRTFNLSTPGWYGIVVFKDGVPPNQTGNGFYRLHVRHSGTPRPAMMSLAPAMARELRSPFPLTVNGSGFVTGSTIRWNGTPLQTTVLSSTVLVAQIPTSRVTTAGVITIDVANPPPILLSGPSTSNTLPFSVQIPYPGSDEDFVLRSSVGGGAFTAGPGGSIHFSPGASQLSIELSSPGGSVNGHVYFLLAQFRETQSTELVTAAVGWPAPIVWIDVSNALLLSSPGFLGLFPVLAPGPNVSSFSLPFVPPGTSLFLQAAAVSQQTSHIPGVMVSDAHELRF